MLKNTENNFNKKELDLKDLIEKKLIEIANKNDNNYFKSRKTIIIKKRKIGQKYKKINYMNFLIEDYIKIKK